MDASRFSEQLPAKRLSRRRLLQGVGASAIGAILGSACSGNTRDVRFGADVNLGRVPDLEAMIEFGRSGPGGVATPGRLHRPALRLYLVSYPTSALNLAGEVYPSQVLTGMREGVLALHDRCPVEGCLIGFCEASGYFQCGCGDSEFNLAGEKRSGSAPRGMDNFAMQINGDRTLTVKTSTMFPGPPIGANTLGQDSLGGFCVFE